MTATRYLTPLREGGSLPAVIEADDEGLYVLKFRGAGQGAKALIAELVAGEIARALGLPVPEIVLIELDCELARTEPDPETNQSVRPRKFHSPLGSRSGAACRGTVSFCQPTVRSRTTSVRY